MKKSKPLYQKLAGRYDCCVLRYIHTSRQRRSVHWVASMPQPRLHALMTLAVCLINSSLSEGQPLSIMEAMALGCPVVARNIPGNRDLIDHGETGLLFNSQEVRIHLVKFKYNDVFSKEFKDCVEILLTNADLRASISRKAMEKMKRHEFQLHTEATEYLKLFNEI